MAFGLGKKTRYEEITEGVSEEAPRIIDIYQSLSITRKRRLLNFYFNPAAIKNKSRFKRSNTLLLKLKAELILQCEAKDKRERGVLDLDKKEGLRSFIA